MTNELAGKSGQLEALARRAVACPGWRWMPGMLCLTDEDGYAARVLHVGLNASTSETADAYSGGGIITRGCLKDESIPDLSDPATVGCLLDVALRVANALGDGRQRMEVWALLKHATEDLFRWGADGQSFERAAVELVAALEASR